MEEKYASDTKSLYYGTRVVWYLFTILEIILLFRFVLKLLGANPGAAFTDFVYAISAPFVAPFFGVFRTAIISTGNVFEWITLLAMFVYWLIAYAIVNLFLVSRPVSVAHAAEKLDEKDRDGF